MKRSILIALLAALVVTGVVAACKFMPRELSYSECSSVYRHFADIFKGLVPLADYDDRGRFSYLDDFPEIFPNAFPSMQKTGAADNRF